MSNSIASLWRAQTFALLACHLFLVLTWFSPCWVLVLVVIFVTSPRSSKTDFVWKTCCVFVLEILSVESPRRVPHLPMCVNLSPFMISNKIGLMSFGAFMKKLGRFEVFFFSSRHGSRPMPGCVPAGSELLPACQPAYAGPGAGRLGAPGGTPAGLCRP